MTDHGTFDGPMPSRYELTGETLAIECGVIVHRIRAIVDIPLHGVTAGDEGGYVESIMLKDGSARVSGSAWVSGSARVSGSAWVSGSARVSDSARVEKPWHLLLVGPIGSEEVTATLSRTKGDKHILNVGCWTGTLGTLSAEVKRRRLLWTADDATQAVWTAQYKALNRLGKATVARWESDGEVFS